MTATETVTATSNAPDRALREDEKALERIDRYEILGELATGGMAEILLARLAGPSGFERVVVVKRILPHLAREAAFVAMFLDEARTVARIHHPNVVQVHELGGEAPDAQGNTRGKDLFLVMEYLEGESVSGLLRRLATRKERLDPWLAAHIVAEACRGLHAAHELTDGDYPLDLVHRDISPQNLFLTYDGTVKILDFGIAKSSDRTSRTEAGQVKGKMLYMSPEQCEGRALDRRSDLFALGAVLSELLTGQSVFRRGSALQSLKAICEQDAPLPSALAPETPPELDAVCARALRRRRDERFGDAAEMRRETLSAMRALGRDDDPQGQLAQLMQTLFADRIEEKREMLRRARTPGEVPVHVPLAEIDEGTDVSEAPPTEIDEAPFVPERAPPPAPVPPSAWAAPTADPPPRRWGLLAIAGVAVAALLGVGAAGARRPTETALPSATSGSAPAVTSSTAGDDPTPSVSASASASAVVGTGTGTEGTVVVHVETIPKGARVLVEGVDRGSTPLDLPLRRGTAAVSLVLQRPGFAPLPQTLVPDSPQRLLLTLQPATSTRSNAARPKATAATIEKLP